MPSPRNSDKLPRGLRARNAPNVSSEKGEAFVAQSSTKYEFCTCGSGSENSVISNLKLY